MDASRDYVGGVEPSPTAWSGRPDFRERFALGGVTLRVAFALAKDTTPFCQGFR